MFEPLERPRPQPEPTGILDPLANLLSPSELLRMLRRQWPLIAGIAACCVLVAVAYVATAPAKFTATATVLIDTRKNRLLENQQVIGATEIDAATVESQAAILKSEAVALKVVRDLNLMANGAYMTSGGSLVGSAIGLVTGLFGDNEPETAYRRERRAIGIFMEGLQIKRVGTTYAIDVSFTSLSPQLSADVANRIADAYMVGELEAKYEATKRASVWLQDRMGELREQAAEAERAVQEFKTANNIVDTGRGLISDQQLSDVNSQLIAARAATAEARARLDRVEAITRDRIPDATIADALRSDVITRLRAQYLDLSAREADFSNRFGVNHGAAVNLRNQMREIQKSIADELGRIAQTFRSDYEIARSREQSIEQSLSQLVGQAAVTGQAQVQLRELESRAQTYRNLYDNFLQRFMEATQQQTFPISEARVITAASPPLRKSAPKTTLILALGVIAGAFFGAAAAIAREVFDDVFRSLGQIEKATQMEALGIVPDVVPVPPKVYQPGDPARRLLPGAIGINRHVVDAPFSRFTETFRAIKVAADISALTRETRVLGIVSSLPHEGKSTVASNLAQLVAHTGQRAILIDADLRNPSLTRALTPDVEEGLIEVLAGYRSEEDVRWTDPVTGMHFLPSPVRGRVSHTADLISSAAFANLLSRLRQSYDYIIMDLPPTIPVVDVKAASHLVDGFVLVVEWGRTTTGAVHEALAACEMIYTRGVGVVLNKAKPGALKRIEHYKGPHYGNYYIETAKEPA